MAMHGADYSRAKFYCKKCHTTFATDLDFIRVVPTIAIANTVQCLMTNIGNVTLGPVLRHTRQRLVGDNPKILVDMAHIYCVTCQTFIGWRIIRRYGPHPIIYEGQCILLVGIGGAVFSLTNTTTSIMY